jgi:hypothetical protein
MTDKRLKRIEDLIAPMRAKPGRKVVLARDFDPGVPGWFPAQARQRGAAAAGRGPDHQAFPEPLQGGAADPVPAPVDLPEKNWKFSAGDARERQRWDDYQTAFPQMLSHTSTKWAPWYVIPADRKWFARIAAAAVIVKALAEIDPAYPVLDAAARRDLLTTKAQLEKEAPEGAARDPFAEELAAAAAQAAQARTTKRARR